MIAKNKGIIAAIEKYAKSDKTNLIENIDFSNHADFSLIDFDKLFDQIFACDVDNKPRLVICGRCGDTVTIGPGNDCTCGYIQELATMILKGKEDE